MPEDAHARAFEIVREALTLPDDEREALIAARCEGDDSLRADVYRLIRSESESMVTGDSPFSTTQAISHRDSLPNQIGPYRVLEVIGEGGFGIVYLAERRGSHVQRVALKLIKPGMDSKEVIARFEAERQALALMEHANIARVLDSGTCDQGRPYFVMEYVPGERITDYCDKHRLTTRDRLEIFAQVCDAVQHAHTKGVIHRDLKPSNILITVRESRVLPVVIDFGVAKAVGGRLTEKTLFTARGQLIGTPEYMSPEQAEMSGVDVDTRSDVYSLGVVLYELLTGVLPFDSDTLRSAAYGEIQRIIREQQPPKPSARLSELGDSATAIAQHRQMDSRGLTRALKNELEWIPLKALRKDRQERYRSAAEFGDDVRNYLAGRGLLAGPESWSYRVHRTIRANRGLARAVVAVGFALALGLGVATWQAIEAHEAREDAERQALVADQARADASSRAEVAEAARREAAATTEQLIELATRIVYALVPTESNERGVDPNQANALEEALVELSRHDDRFGPDMIAFLAESYYALGSLLGGNRGPNLGEYRAALSAFGKSHEYFASLSRITPGKPRCHRWLATSHMRLADTHSALRDETAALPHRELALESSRKYAELEPGADAFRLVDSQLLELAEAYQRVPPVANEVVESLYQASIEGRESRLAQENISQYRRDVAIAYRSYAKFLFVEAEHNNESLKASSLFQQAEQLRRDAVRLLRRNCHSAPELTRSRRDLANALRELSESQVAQFDDSELAHGEEWTATELGPLISAIACLEESLQLLIWVVDRSPFDQRSVRDLCETVNHLCFYVKYPATRDRAAAIVEPAIWRVRECGVKYEHLHDVLAEIEEH